MPKTATKKKASKKKATGTHTEIVCIVDKSGSMGSVVDDAIGGFNEFLKGQQKVKGKANISVILFDTSYRYLYEGVDIQKAQKFTNNNYVPSGMTALLDAVGRGISDLSQRIKGMDKKPKNVIFCILTDGEENSSREHTKKTVADLIKKYQKKKWDFVFLGANIDSFAEAGKMGFKSANVTNMKSDGKGIKAGLRSASAYCFAVRTGGEVRSMADYYEAEDSKLRK